MEKGHQATQRVNVLKEHEQGLGRTAIMISAFPSLSTGKQCGQLYIDVACTNN